MVDVDLLRSGLRRRSGVLNGSGLGLSGLGDGQRSAFKLKLGLGLHSRGRCTAGGKCPTVQQYCCVG